MTRQTDCASAITVTITESTAESLILFTAGTLKSKAIDKAAGAERERYERPAFGGTFSDDNGSTYGTAISNAPATEAAKQWEGWGTALKPAAEEWWLFRKPPIGTIAANVLEHGTGGLNIDGCRVGVGGEAVRFFVNEGGMKFNPGGPTPKSTSGGFTDAGRWPANLIHDGSEEVLALFPETTSGSLTGQPRTENKIYGSAANTLGTPRFHEGDSGSAARFFYCAKASRDDRDEGCGALPLKECGIMEDDNYPIKTGSGNLRETKRNNPHPTVKPTDLMRYLCRLITPPNGIVLDPFMGSGSTGKAAMAEGFRFIGIEREAEYIEIARARISAEAEKPRQLSLF
jgi:site-specific DNA-methyltransferase (adenine-specific)